MPTNYEIVNVYDQERGCGKRKPGGTYLVDDPTPTMVCRRMPLPISRCPVCDCGIKFSRGWTWINAKALFANQACTSDACAACPIGNSERIPEKAGLLWVGEKFYPTPAEFLAEQTAQGISKRIATVPHRFRLGETVVFLAHKKAIVTMTDDGPVFSPGIFYMFKPARIEYVVEGDESANFLQDRANRGHTLVRLSRRPVPREPRIGSARIGPFEDLIRPRSARPSESPALPYTLATTGPEHWYIVRGSVAAPFGSRESAQTNLDRLALGGENRLSWVARSELHDVIDCPPERYTATRDATGRCGIHDSQENRTVWYGANHESCLRGLERLRRGEVLPALWTNDDVAPATRYGAIEREGRCGILDSIEARVSWFYGAPDRDIWLEYMVAGSHHAWELYWEDYVEQQNV